MLKFICLSCTWNGTFTQRYDFDKQFLKNESSDPKNSRETTDKTHWQW